jgi:hypothetical protein
MQNMQAPKYLTIWKAGRWVFLKREDFERRQGRLRRFLKHLKSLLKG